jgi:DDE superfamily endonuclease
MPDIMVFFACLSPCLDRPTLRQLHRVTEAMLAMTGRVTMRGLSRWAGKGGSYRTVQRFFTTSCSWATLQWVLIRHHLLEPHDVIFMGGDDVVGTKSGKQTYGLDRFFSSLYGRVVPGLDVLSLSLISVTRRTSYPVIMEQLEKQPTAPPQEVSETKSHGKRGRPRGSKNQQRRDVTVSPYLRFVQETIKRLLGVIGAHLQVMYFVFDGAFGHNDALQMVRQLGLHLISKLRYDAALYFPYDGPYSGRGKRKKYGKKLDYQHMPEAYLKESSVEKYIETKISQMNIWHKKFADLLNIVVIVKTNMKTQAVAHVVLFSSDLAISYEQLIDYYRLRFQLEFNFRDAKQYWGLEDFMTVKQTPVYNSANLAMFMVNVSHAVMRPMRTQWPECSVNDLKAWFRSRKYVVETLKLLPEMPDPIFIAQAIDQMAQLGRVNHAVSPV